MGHHLTAIIAKAPIKENKAIELGLAVIFEGAFIIVPIPFECIWELAPDEDHGDEPAGLFNSQVPHQLASELGMGAYALIETDYFGGMGEQNARFYSPDGLQPRDVTINEALRALGVARIPAFREPTNGRGPWLKRLACWLNGDQYLSEWERSNRYPITDEFDMIGLGNHRDCRSDAYWDDEKAGQRFGKVLFGRRGLWHG